MNNKEYYNIYWSATGIFSIYWYIEFFLIASACILTNFYDIQSTLYLWWIVGIGYLLLIYFILLHARIEDIKESKSKNG